MSEEEMIGGERSRRPNVLRTGKWSSPGHQCHKTVLQLAIKQRLDNRAHASCRAKDADENTEVQPSRSKAMQNEVGQMPA